MVVNRQRAGRRQYEIKRALLILLMGSKCKYCNERRPWKLEFHHTKKAGWSPTKTSRRKRIHMYLCDYAKGICVLACGTCNKKKGQPTDKEPIPF